MTKKILTGLSSSTYEHPFDRNALESLEKMPGVSMVFKKINENGIDRLLRLQSTGSDIRVNADNFPDLYQALVDACHILDVSPVPELYLFFGSGHIETFTIGVDQTIVMINIEGMERLSTDELVYVFGHEIAHIKSQHLLYHQNGDRAARYEGCVKQYDSGAGGVGHQWGFGGVV